MEVRGRTGDQIALLGAQCGVFPSFVWERAKGGKIVDCAIDVNDRPALEEFLGMQRRFHHLVRRDASTGSMVVRPERAETVERLKPWTQSNVERLYRLGELK